MGNLLQALKREVATGMLLGIVMGVVGLGVAMFWTQDWRIAQVVALTLPLVVIWSVSVATVVPTIADRLNIDPTVISGPMISTIVDATGLLIYFQLATMLLNI